MLYGFLLTIYIINCIFLIMIVLIQKGKGSTGLGNLGGGTQMLFGGSGGQDIFQKITWVLGTIFMAGALVLSVMKSIDQQRFKYIATEKATIKQDSAETPSSAQ